MPKINLIEKYPHDSAGRLMITNVPVVGEDVRVADIDALLVSKRARFETINYIYVVDRRGRLSGVISIKELFRAAKNKRAGRLFSRKLVTVQAGTDKERLAYLALANSLKAIPVVAKDKRFLGTVPSDTILRILHEETSEDMFRMGGITHAAPYDNILDLPLSTSLKHRLPWLVIGLAGGMLAAAIVGRFESIISRHILLAAFIPLIVYMSGAVSAQMQTFMIRDLALHAKLPFARYLSKQGGVVLTIGLGLSVLLYFLSLLLYGAPDVSFVLGVALFFAIFSSLFTGLVVPFIFNKLRFDPANASGPIATIIQDVLSIVVYLSIAFFIL